MTKRPRHTHQILLLVEFDEPVSAETARHIVRTHMKALGSIPCEPIAGKTQQFKMRQTETPLFKYKQRKSETVSYMGPDTPTSITRKS